MNLLSTHGRVLAVINANPTTRLIDIGRALGMTEGATWTIVNELVEVGYIERVRAGRRNSYVVRRDTLVHQDLNAGLTIGTLLDLFVAANDPAPTPSALEPSTPEPTT